jgi:hypothetical protein
MGEVSHCILFGTRKIEVIAIPHSHFPSLHEPTIHSEHWRETWGGIGVDGGNARLAVVHWNVRQSTESKSQLSVRGICVSRFKSKRLLIDWLLGGCLALTFVAAIVWVRIKRPQVEWLENWNFMVYFPNGVGRPLSYYSIEVGARDPRIAHFIAFSFRFIVSTAIAAIVFSALGVLIVNSISRRRVGT